MAINYPAPIMPDMDAIDLQTLLKKLSETKTK